MDTNKERGYSYGIMDRYMMESGVKVESMEVECGKPPKHQNSHILESGLMGNLMDSESISTMWGTDMRVSLSMA